MFERCDVTFENQGLRCAGWYYVPRDTKLQGPQPAIVMAHGFSAVKEMYLDNFAEQFAEAG
jgi:cephalosporin-C deacetylase-like acetyl esterase